MSASPPIGRITDVPMKFRRRGGKTVMVLPDGSRAIERKEAVVDNAMVKLVARGYHRVPHDASSAQAISSSAGYLAY